MRILKGIGRSLRDRGIDPADTDAKLGWLLVVGTIPAGILGLLLQDKLRSVFASAPSAAAFLTANGVLLYGAELLRRRAPQTETDDDTRIARQVGWRAAVAVGTAQALALIPGFSRSGATMGGGLLVGLSNKDAARFAFLLATPIIGAAAMLKLPELFGSARQRRPRPGARRRRLLGGDRLSRGPLPDAVLRDADADAVRGLLPRSPGFAARRSTFAADVQTLDDEPSVQLFHSGKRPAMARLRLTPQKREFFDLFTQAAANARDDRAAARRVARGAGPTAASKLHDIREAEHEGDRLTHEVINLLNRTFVTPFDRDDMYRLATRDRRHLRLRRRGRRQHRRLRGARRPAAGARAGRRSSTAPQRTSTRRSSCSRASATRIASSSPCASSRTRATGSQREAVADLFRSGQDPLTIIRWKDIHEQIEEAVDACENAADVLEAILVKNR